jgi:tetratricopeptide (TPR) repeat protein
MKTGFFCGLFFLFIIGFSIAQEPDNNAPRYGNVKKSQTYIDIDNKFISEVVQQFGSRKEAAKKQIEFGWDYLQRGDNVTAMKRFNQAWLLDSTLIDIYWGFGAVMGARKQYDQSIAYLKKYYQGNPKNERIMIDLSTSYFQYAFTLRQKGALNLWRDNMNNGKTLLKKAILINDKNAYAFSQLAIAYYYENKIDSSKYYGNIANRLDSKILNPEYKKTVGIK